MKAWPINRFQNYGIIGDLHTIALVGMNGSIDWFCYPHFDSPSVFAAILDDREGRAIHHRPDRPETSRTSNSIGPRRTYWSPGICRLTVSARSRTICLSAFSEGDPRRHQLVRRVQVVRGSMSFRMECTPAFNYSRDAHETSDWWIEGVCFHSPTLELSLGTRQQLRQGANRGRQRVHAGGGRIGKFRARRDHEVEELRGIANVKTTPRT